MDGAAGACAQTAQATAAPVSTIDVRVPVEGEGEDTQHPAGTGLYARTAPLARVPVETDVGGAIMARQGEVHGRDSPNPVVGVDERLV